MNKAVALFLLGLVTVLSVLGCAKGNDQAGQLPAPANEVTPVEATTTQGSKVVLLGGDISWADALVSFTPGDPAPTRSRDPKAALGRMSRSGTVAS
jgi:hypothetical protein